MYWNERIETLSSGEMIDLQSAALRKTIRYTYDRVPFYRQRIDSLHINPDEINTLDDIVRLPFTVKADLRDQYPYGLCAVPLSDIQRLHASSGTTGQPTPVFNTRIDLDNWSGCMARNLYMAGVRKEDICQIAFKYTLFTGAFGHHLGADTIGAMVIPASSGQTERQVLMMRDFKTTVLHCTPSYAITITEKMDQMGISREDLCLRVGVHGAEPMSDSLRSEIEEKLGTLALGDYGLTELGGPGVSIECPAKAGYHINEDYFFPEVVNPETLEPVPEGETGELVLTTLKKHAMPLIRYRTRDITRLHRGPCACGRTLIRHAPILGRTDDMLIFGGVNVFPSQLESLLLEFEEASSHYLIRLTTEHRRDRITVEIEPVPGFSISGNPDQNAALIGKMTARIKDLIGITIGIKLVEPNTIPRSEGKAKRVVDER
ncbi:MAG: phenylacetate--CoA ligase [Desulfobacteraceae bacterium]|nr:phenylacetate--CoA ligase [Desulfobacteraceae bacterium]